MPVAALFVGLRARRAAVESEAQRRPWPAQFRDGHSTTRTEDEPSRRTQPELGVTAPRGRGPRRP